MYDSNFYGLWHNCPQGTRGLGSGYYRRQSLTCMNVGVNCTRLGRSPYLASVYVAATAAIMSPLNSEHGMWLAVFDALAGQPKGTGSKVQKFNKLKALFEDSYPNSHDLYSPGSQEEAEKLENLIKDVIPRIIGGRKTTAFFWCMIEHPRSNGHAVIDGHMWSAHLGSKLRMMDAKLNKRMYDTAEYHLLRIAALNHEPLRNVQAVLWFRWKEIHDTNMGFYQPRLFERWPEIVSQEDLTKGMVEQLNKRYPERKGVNP